ncbi:DUF92 domain-containing protein [Defluviitalea phaphyphila]|uniref:DUF92 domain-containing protein n=1 Tax=Defluviitalea phaphyphila TaxID=1473580 RepID=UPI00072FC983|nr:DUF92 domain-containing protein [Defluviitalea phaphyphila]
MIYFIKFIIGLVASSIISYIGYKKHALTLNGCIGAIILGTGIFFSSHFYGSFLIVIFFTTSTIFTFIKENIKKELNNKYEKNSGRDFFQVFANGGVGLFYSFIYYFTSNPIYLVLIGVSFSAPNADTWASELGVLSKNNPISIRTFKKVSKGTSGAISFLGIIFSLLGSIIIALSSVITILILKLEIYSLSLYEIFFLISLGGFLGSVIDSLLGATAQGIYYNDILKIETEKPFYKEKPNTLIRGYKIFNNDFVNFISILLSTIIIYFLYNFMT